MKLLIITQKVDRSDSILGFFHRWIEEFARTCEKVTIICLYKGEYQLPANVEVISLGKERGVSKITYLYNFYKSIFAKRKEYDVVFVHMNPIYVLCGGIVWKLLGKKIALWYTHKNVDIKLRVAEVLTDIIFSASKESFRLSSKKLCIMGHGIDTHLFKPAEKIAHERYKMISVGRISPVKKYELLIEAVEELINTKKYKIEVDIIGGPGTSSQEAYYDDLQKMVRDKHLESYIHFLGPKPQAQIVHHLQQADIFVNMSETGSLDKAILEAMACGTLVLSCNEAFKPILEPYKLFFLTKEDLVKKTEMFYTHEANRSEVESILRNIVVEKYNVENLIPEIIKELSIT